VLAAASARSDELVATLTLDGLSFVSFQDEETIPLPSGSTIRFRFAAPQSSEAAAFTIRPEDVSIEPVSLSNGRSLRYGMSGPATGSVRKAGAEWILQFQGEISATLQKDGEDAGTSVYSIPFTTETVSASNLMRTESVEVTGLRLVDGAWYAQIVGATVNERNAYPKPGAAVYTVLSGTFDRFPPMP
jgi:hypothetical protein